jgi:hypothetical protein
MFQYTRKQAAEPIIRYLMTTMTVGGGLGVSHGIAASANKRDLRTVSILHDGMAGAIAGPWAPIFVPLVLTGIWPVDGCPYRNMFRK